MQRLLHGGARRRVLVSLTVAGALVALAVGPTGVAGAAAHHHGARGRHAAGGATITAAPWGSLDGTPVDLYTLRNARGMAVRISNYGGVVQSIWVPDRSGG
jgi:aldose 1-epimerase